MNKSSEKHMLHERTPFDIWLFKDGKQEHENKSNPIAQNIQQLIQDSLILTQFELDFNRLKSVPYFNDAEYCADEVFIRFS